MPKLLVIDDEQSIRSTLRDILEYEGYEVDEARDGEEGLKKVIADSYAIVLCDIKMPKMDGMEVLEKAMLSGTEAQFIMISAHATIETAVDATKKGAFDFIEKPPDLNRLLVSLKNAQDKQHLVQETKVLRKKISKKFQMVGSSDALQQVQETIDKVAPTDARVLITGPNGTGKELVARALHEKSNRSKAPFIEVNCAAIPSELIESELFGHEKGAFTSAVKQRIGKFEQANGGTLFLDEIGDMSLSAQAKVLRALQEHKITRVGGDKNIKVDVRVIAATNRDLRQMIEEKQFREDLYHRLSVILLRVPALQDRKEDIPELIEHFLDALSQEYGNARKTITSEAVSKLQEGSWTGNIRELRNVVERLVIMSGQQITEEDVSKYAEISL